MYFELSVCCNSRLKRFVIDQIVESNILRIPNSIVYFRKTH